MLGSGGNFILLCPRRGFVDGLGAIREADFRPFRALVLTNVATMAMIMSTAMVIIMAGIKYGQAEQHSIERS